MTMFGQGSCELGPKAAGGDLPRDGSICSLRVVIISCGLIRWRVLVFGGLPEGVTVKSRSTCLVWVKNE